MARRSRVTASPNISTDEEGNLTADPTVTGTTQQGDVTLSGTVDTEGGGRVGVGTQQGDVRYNAGVDSQGNVGVGVGTQTGEGTVGIGANTSGNVGLNYQSDSNGDVNYNVGIGYNTQTGGAGASGSVQIGDSQGATTGGQYGQIAGTVIGTYLGGAAGGAIGGVLGSAAGSYVGGAFEGRAGRETDDRKRVIEAYRRAGVLDENYVYTFPDGTKYDFSKDPTISDRKFKYSDKEVGEEGYKKGDKPLYDYEIDYTNDTDYLAGMMGINLSRIMAGETSKAIDQVGNQLGNAFLGKTGYGSDLNEESFNNVVDNARSMYAHRGIESKEEMLALANKMYSDGRIKDSDYAVMQQTADIVFDKDFTKATQLMSGRQKGIETANETPSNAEATGSSFQGEDGSPRENRPGRIYSPIISPEEAMLSVQPYLAQYRQMAGKRGGGGLNDWAAGITALAGMYQKYQEEQKKQGGGGGKSGGSIKEDIKDYEVEGDYQLDTSEELQDQGVGYNPEEGEPDYQLGTPDEGATTDPGYDLGDYDYGDFQIDSGEDTGYQLGE